MKLTTLWPLALLALVYWDARKLVPYATKVARCSVLLSGALVTPFCLYATFNHVPRWYPGQPLWLTLVATAAGAGLFVALLMAGICLILDAIRRP